MIYRLFSSVGNTVGIDNYIAYWQIDSTGHHTKSLEIRADGVAVRYSKAHEADHFGQLPEGVWDEQEASKTKYGVLVPITEELFNSVWEKTHCNNDELQSF